VRVLFGHVVRRHSDSQPLSGKEFVRAKCLKNKIGGSRPTLPYYSLEFEGRFILVENVPARVNVERGERLQQMVWNQGQPRRVIETPVFEFPEGA